MSRRLSSPTQRATTRRTARSAAAIAVALGVVSIGAHAGATAPTNDSSAPAAGSVPPLPAEFADAGEFVIGSELSTPPLTFFDEDGETILGFNSELAIEIGERLGVDVTFEQYAFAGLIPAVQSGKVDFAMDVINDTRERQEVVDFIDYFTNGTTMLLPEGNPEGIEMIGDLCGHSAAVVQGSAQIALVEEQSAKCEDAGEEPIDIRQFAKPPDARLQVQSGNIDVFFGNTPVMLYLAENADGGSAFDVADEEQYLQQPVGIIFDKGQSELRDVIFAVMQGIWADGTYLELMTKYGMESIALDEPTINGATT